MFESFVNSERCKTLTEEEKMCISLRALLIQKDVKQPLKMGFYPFRLRALLIQKDVKLLMLCLLVLLRLRALLIQKDVKLF